MDFSIIRELRKVNLIEELEAENYSEEFAAQIAEDLLEPQEPAYVCNNAEELSAALSEMSGD